MRLSGDEIRRHDDTELGVLASQFLGHHPAIADASPAVLGRTVRDLHYLVSINNNISEVTGYFLTVRRLQMIRHVLDALGNHIPGIAAVNGQPQERFRLWDRLGNALPSPIEQEFPVIGKPLHFPLSPSIVIDIDADILNRLIQDSRPHLCDRGMFTAACFFLAPRISKRPPYEFIDGEAPELVESKKFRQPLDMTDASSMDWLLRRISRPLQQRGEVAARHARAAVNTLMSAVYLDGIKDAVVVWARKRLDTNRKCSIRDIMQHFGLSFRIYRQIEQRLRHQGREIPLSTEKGRRSVPSFTIQAELLARVRQFAQNNDLTLHQALNEILDQYFQLVDTYDEDMI